MHDKMKCMFEIKTSWEFGICSVLLLSLLFIYFNCVGRRNRLAGTLHLQRSGSSVQRVRRHRLAVGPDQEIAGCENWKQELPGEAGGFDCL